ncbi:hypothetical protein MNV49_004823 [Pseudohyphozyma bogoriensis]|nr:hypothetical protein MNV49_004823 [Pseudohyphozyma bogoriensis]
MPGSVTYDNIAAPISGTLHSYTIANRVLTAFETSPSQPNLVLFLGGLHDGFNTIDFSTKLGGVRKGWGCAQVLTSSSYQGWGEGSVERDVKEIGEAVKYFWKLGKEKIVLLGHSTGSQQIIGWHHLAKTLSLPPITASIIHAPISDREYLMHYIPTLPKTTITPEGVVSEEEFVPVEWSNVFGPTRVTWRRWKSLADVPEGDEVDIIKSEDFFSTDLSDARLANVFAPISSPFLVFLCGLDHCYSPLIQSQLSTLLDRFQKSTDAKYWSKESSVLEGSGHATPELGPQAVLLDKVGNFLASNDPKACPLPSLSASASTPPTTLAPRDPAPLPPSQWIALIERGGCPFSAKVRTAMELGAEGVVFGDLSADEGGLGGIGGLLTPWSPDDTSDITIPSSFVSRASYMSLIKTWQDQQHEAGKHQPASGLVVIMSKDEVFAWPLLDLLLLILFLPSLLTLLTVFTQRIRQLRQQKLDRAPKDVVDRLPILIWAGEKGLGDALVEGTVGVDRVERGENEAPGRVEDEESAVGVSSEFVKGEEVLLLPCGHLFHKDEIVSWLVGVKRICPTCRASITTDGDAAPPSPGDASLVPSPAAPVAIAADAGREEEYQPVAGSSTSTIV